MQPPSYSDAREQTSAEHASGIADGSINPTHKERHMTTPTRTHDPLHTNTQEVIEMDEDTDTDKPSKVKRNYFAIYHSPELLQAVELARGDESANAFLTRMICSQLNVPVPERKTRRRAAATTEAMPEPVVEVDNSAEANRILAQKAEYAALLASAMAVLES